jgi:hypothetical protein
MKKVVFIVAILLFLLITFIFRDEFVYFNIGDIFYVISYFTIAIYISSILFFIYIIKFTCKRFTKRKF